jgi:hypothetical protein
VYPFDEEPAQRASRYDTQQICLEGHQITAGLHGRPIERKQRSVCGQATMFRCLECGSEIKGECWEPGGAAITTAHGVTLVDGVGVQITYRPAGDGRLEPAEVALSGFRNGNDFAIGLGEGTLQARAVRQPR